MSSHAQCNRHRRRRGRWWTRTQSGGKSWWRWRRRWRTDTGLLSDYCSCFCYYCSTCDQIRHRDGDQTVQSRPASWCEAQLDVRLRPAPTSMAPPCNPHDAEHPLHVYSTISNPEPKQIPLRKTLQQKSAPSSRNYALRAPLRRPTRETSAALCTEFESGVRQAGMDPTIQLPTEKLFTIELATLSLLPSWARRPFLACSPSRYRHHRLVLGELWLGTALDANGSTATSLFRVHLSQCVCVWVFSASYGRGCWSL